MFEKMLVPLDGSEVAERIVPYAAGVATGLGARMTLFMVVEPPPLELATTMAEVGVPVESVALAQRAAAYLKGVGQRLPDGVHWETRVATGVATEHIVYYARRGGFGLIAMATHGRSGITRWVQGSVTDEVVRRSSVPVLVIRPQEEAPPPAPVRYHSVVVPLDGSAIAESVVGAAEELARRLGLRVVLLRVVDVSQVAALVGAGAESYVPRLLAAMRTDAHTYLEGVAGRLRGRGLPDVRVEVWEGSPAARIVEMGKLAPGAIITMGTHGRSGARRLLLGSVADRVVRTAEVPVLLVRPRE